MQCSQQETGEWGLIFKKKKEKEEGGGTEKFCPLCKAKEGK